MVRSNVKTAALRSGFLFQVVFARSAGGSMEYVVTKKETIKDITVELYYAGYQAESWSDCGPIFNRTITHKARFDEKTADMAVKQLTEMGYEVSKRAIKERKLKPKSELDRQMGQPHHGH